MTKPEDMTAGCPDSNELGYEKPGITTLSSDEIIEGVGPATAVGGSPCTGPDCVQP